jgi:uncharacterized repeat protein (TIGR01451 family)
MKAIKNSTPQKRAALVLFSSVDKEKASAGDILKYTVNYTNKGRSPLTNIVIRDKTPTHTSFMSAGHGPLPKHIVRIAISSPPVGNAGEIKWTLTGSLAPGRSSMVTSQSRFRVDWPGRPQDLPRLHAATALARAAHCSFHTDRRFSQPIRFR